MSIDSSGVSGGSTIGGNGAGQVDFDTNAMKVTFDYSGSARLQGLQLKELFVGGHLYIAPSQNGQGVSTLLPGKEWVESPASVANQVTGTGNQNPADMLAALAAKGDTVVDVGPAEIGGVTTEEYSVTGSPAAALARLSQEHLPASIVKGAEAFISAGPFKMKVWVDQSSEMIRQMAVAIPVPGDSGAAVTVTMGLADFGTPVSIVPPPVSTVATYAQYEQATKAVQSPAA
jgi:hypothetical protein